MKARSTDLLTVTSTAVCMTLLFHVLLLSDNVSSVEIVVCPRTAACNINNITEALNNITSEVETITQLRLQPGTHSLTEYILIQNITAGLSIIGEVNDITPVVIRCNRSNSEPGLAFYGVHNLTLENLVIEECSGGGPNSTTLDHLIKNTFKVGLFDFSPLTSLLPSFALFLVNCQNVSISTLTVRNTSGIGLVGINLLGLELENSTFHNSAGGGVKLLYLDYQTLTKNISYQVTQTTATISNCTFLGNVDQIDSCVSELSSDCGSRYKVGGGGGLTIILSQLSFGVNVEILSTRFENNSAMVSGGVYVSMFRGVDNSSIKVSDCLFDGNRGLETNSTTGGMMVSINLPYPSTLQEPAPPKNTTIYITIQGTTFTSNTATIAGGVNIKRSLGFEPIVVNTVHVLVDQCQFEENKARGASALAITQESLDKSLQNSLKVVLKNSNFKRNANIEEEALLATVGTQTANFTLDGVLFQQNYGVALYALRSSIHMMNQVYFIENSGLTCGGGLKLSDSVLVLTNNSRLSFRDNTARIAGNDICVDRAVSDLELWRQPKVTECFIYCSSKASESLNCSATITIQERSHARSSIFLPPADRNISKLCPNLDKILQVSNYEMLYSTPVSLIEAYPEARTNVNGECDPDQHLEPIMPGDTINITVTAYNSRGNPVPDTVTIYYKHAETVGDLHQIFDCSYKSKDLVRIGSYLLSNRPKIFPLTLHGPNTHMSNVCVIVWSQSSLQNAQFMVNLTECFIGYEYHNESGSCECITKSQSGVECDRVSRNFTIPGNKWFGPLQDEDENRTSNDLLVIGLCPLDYCKPNEKNTCSPNFTSQCTNGSNRFGLLCGVCQQNFSVTMGTSQCKKCSNYYLFLIAPFALFGLLLIIAMAKLRITISEGFLNSVLFYCNVANYLYAYIFPGGDYYFSLIILAGVLSIKPRLGLCLFDGMTSLHYFLFQYAFVLYLYALLGAFLLLVRLKVITTHSPIKLFATLLLLCYGSVTELCITTLALLRVQTLDGMVYWRWYIDPTVHYGQGLHLFLCITAIILMFIYIIPTTFLTIIPQRVYNIRYVGRLKPLYDAVWAPFKPRYRWWFGFRLMLRWVVMIIATFLHFSLPSSTFALVIILSVLSYLHTALSPFQGTWQNRTDSFLLANLVLLVIGALYFQNGIISPVPGQIIYSGVLITSAYVLFVVLLLRHLYSRFSVRVKGTFSRFKLSKWKRGYTLHSTQEESETSSDEEDEAGVLTQSDSSVQVEGEGSRQGELNLWQQENTDPESEELGLRSKVVTFSEFREPLLDEGEAEMTTFATLRRKVKPSTKK